MRARDFVNERSKDYHERERAVDEFEDTLGKLDLAEYQGLTPDIIRRMKQLVQIFGRGRTIYAGPRNDKFGSAGSVLDGLVNRYRKAEIKAGRMPEFAGRANTAHDMAQQIAQQTRGRYDYNMPRTWVTGAGQRYRDPQDYIVYPDEQSYEDAWEWIQSRGQKVHYRDNFGSLNTAIKIGRYVVEPASVTRGVFSKNPETTHRMSVRSAAAINQSVRSQVDITDQQAAALKDIAATKNSNAMAGIQAMMAVLQGEQDVKDIIDRSRKIDPRDKAKLDAIIAGAQNKKPGEQDVAEGAKWRQHPDAYDMDDEGNKTPRDPNSPKFGYDPLQRRADTAGDAKTARGRTSALKTSLRMAQGQKGVSEGDTLDTGPDGRLTARGEEQMQRYRDQKKAQERQQIIAKHTKTVKGDTYGVAPTRISQSKTETDWAAANAELRKKGLLEQDSAHPQDDMQVLEYYRVRTPYGQDYVGQLLARYPETGIELRLPDGHRKWISRDYIQSVEWLDWKDPVLRDKK